MKLLLTSAGITNKSLEKALRGLVKEDIKIAFIPTAANLEDGEKDWLIKNYNQCEELGTVDIVDISAMDKNIWLPRLERANVLVFGGGNTGHLMREIIKSGLNRELPYLLKNRVYVGISAGSLVTSTKISASSEFLYGDEHDDDPDGLGYVDFHIRPHLNSPYFPKVNDKNLREVSKKLKGNLYAIDDNSAVLYIDGKIKVISEGVWKKY
jgi:dipeptidase E